ncbi:flagellar filament capping protein FliD [Rubrivivax rivuli]|uniref:Flagellar hook-associated protein 2 n=1 Tax=Rubrivivax rivuli TaxID=1862385 RepID=A0A437RIJ6_9BURK|nr:flagellar filament capping protein FliD [Rubrivivax rivuli]RVU46597.1 flagellar hook protein [Rubrivivax rivuli]
MAISSAGIGSGLDVKNIVSQLLTIERAPIRQLQTEAGRLQTQLSAFGRVQSALSTLRDASQKLTQNDTWGAAKATSSDSANVSATATGSAQAGSYSISVTRLAVAQTLSTNSFSSASQTLGSGILRIELGNFDAVPPVPKSGANAVDITVEPGQNSLTAIRDKINNAGAGVVASVVTDVSGSRLVMRSAQTGLENSFRITALDDDGNDTNASGLSALAFDPSANVTNLGRPQPPQNALVTLNGVQIESASNTLNDAVEGLSLTLRKPGTDAEVRVEPDTEALKKSVDDFVKAYNESIKLLREQTRYDPATKQAGPLQGDRSGTAMLSQLRGLFNGNGGNSTVFARLADVGLDLDTDGLIKTNATKLDAALTQGAELKKLFANVDATTPANEGFAKRFEGWLKLSLDSEGTIESRTQSLQARVKNNEQAQERLEDRVARTEKRLLNQYTALDTRMGQLSGLSNYVTQQMALLNNTNNNR